MKATGNGKVEPQFIVRSAFPAKLRFYLRPICRRYRREHRRLDIEDVMEATAQWPIRKWRPPIVHFLKLPPLLLFWQGSNTGEINVR